MKNFISSFFVVLFYLSNLWSADQVKVWDLNPMSVTDNHNAYEAQTLLTRSSERGTELQIHLWDHLNPARYTQIWVRAEPSEQGDLKQYFLGDSVIFSINVQDLSKGVISSDGAQDVTVLTDLNFKEGNKWLLPEDLTQLVESSLALDGVEHQVFDAELLHHNYRTEVEENQNGRLSRLHYLQLKIGMVGDPAIALSASLFEDVYFGLNPTDMEGLTNPFLKGMRKWQVSDSYKILVNPHYPGFWWLLNATKNEAVFSAQGKLLIWETNLWKHMSR